MAAHTNQLEYQIKALENALPNAKNKYAVQNKIKQLKKKLEAIKHFNWLAQ